MRETRRGVPLAVHRGRATALGAGIGSLPLAAEACAMCVEWGREWQGLNAGFYWSAVLLTALPFVLVAVAGVRLRRLLSTAARPSASEQSGPTAAGGQSGLIADPSSAPAAATDTGRTSP